MPKAYEAVVDGFSAPALAISASIFSAHFGQSPCVKVASVRLRTYCSTLCQ